MIATSKHDKKKNIQKGSHQEEIKRREKKE